MATTFGFTEHLRKAGQISPDGLAFNPRSSEHRFILGDGTFRIELSWPQLATVETACGALPALTEAQPDVQPYEQ